VVKPDHLRPSIAAYLCGLSFFFKFSTFPFIACNCQQWSLLWHKLGTNHFLYDSSERFSSSGAARWMKNESRCRSLVAVLVTLQLFVMGVKIGDESAN